MVGIDKILIPKKGRGRIPILSNGVYTFCKAIDMPILKLLILKEFVKIVFLVAFKMSENFTLDLCLHFCSISKKNIISKKVKVIWYNVG